MSEPTLVMKLTALRDYVMVLGVSEDDCEVFDEAVEAIVSARSAALDEAARVAAAYKDECDMRAGQHQKQRNPRSQDAALDMFVAARDIEDAIRSLKAQPDTRTPTEGESL